MVDFSEGFCEKERYYPDLLQRFCAAILFFADFRAKALAKIDHWSILAIASSGNQQKYKTALKDLATMGPRPGRPARGQARHRPWPGGFCIRHILTYADG